jgi:hypothetical protein
MPSIGEANSFFLQATARLSHAVVPQAIASACYRVAAVALAQPYKPFPFVVSNRAKRDQSTKSSASNIDGFFSKGDILGGHQKFTFLLSNPGTIRRRCPVFSRFLLVYYSTFGLTSPYLLPDNQGVQHG